MDNAGLCHTATKLEEAPELLLRVTWWEHQQAGSSRLTGKAASRNQQQETILDHQNLSRVLLLNKTDESRTVQGQQDLVETRARLLAPAGMPTIFSLYRSC